MQEIEFTSKKGHLYGHKWEINNPKAIIVLITGMAEHSARYNKFSSFLNKNGYSVYCLDHFGQGKNGELGNPDENFFNLEQDIFLDFIMGLKKKFSLNIYIFAHSMGSFMTQAYIEKYSSTVDKVVLCGTNGKNPLASFGKFLSKIIVNDKNINKKAGVLHNLTIGAYEKSIKDSTIPNEWLSYNLDNVKAYNEDPLSGVHPTNGFYKGMIGGIASIQKTKNVKNISSKLPILIIGGDSDPVSNNAKGLKNLYNLYKKNGLDVTLKIMPHMRHEILNEDNFLDVYNEILSFYEK